jgi:sortase A
VNGFWELSETSASHGVGSSNPGQLGNIVIFAHARDDLFGPLRNIKQSTMIYILTQDRWFRYEVKETKLVDPGDIQVIASTTDETLTLYTCDGFLDSNRLIITAKPQK